MMRINTLVFVFLGLFTFAPMVFAQDGGDPALAERIALARKMHDIKPMAVQIEQAIRQLALRYPEDKQELFITKMLQVFDRKSLTDISVKAMAETFTAAELEKMIDFHGSPEGKAIGEKMPVYQALVEPEIIKKIDQALMEVRTGGIGSQP